MLSSVIMKILYMTEQSELEWTRKIDLAGGSVSDFILHVGLVYMVL